MRFFKATTPSILRIWKMGALISRFGKAAVDAATSRRRVERYRRCHKTVYLPFDAMNHGPMSSVSKTTIRILPESRLYSCTKVTHGVPST